MTAPLPGQMFDHMLNADKGWPSQTALDFTANISANVLYALQPGQVCHLNSSLQLEPGVANWQMPMFIIQGANDLDVNNANNGQWYPISPRGGVACLVGKGPYELWTTEFDTTQTYTPNQPLRAPTGLAANQAGISGTLTNQGVIAIATSSTTYTAICGLVSKGVVTNAYGKQVLCFWPVWYPGNPSET